MKHFSLFLALAGFVFLGIGVESAEAQGNGAVSQKSDLTFSIYNECCDEIITISATGHWVFNQKTGKSHFNLQNPVAEGSNGNTYEGNYVSNSSSTANEDGTYSGTSHIRIEFTSENGCSYSVHILTSWTWDPVTNVYTEDVKKYEIECTGESEGDLS